MTFSTGDQGQFAGQRRSLQDRYWLRQMLTGNRPDSVGLQQLSRLREQENFKRGGGMFGPIGPGVMSPVFEATEAMNPEMNMELEGGRGQDSTLRQFRGDVAPSIAALRRTSRAREMK